MRTIRRQAKATSLDHAIELAKQHAKEQHRPSKVMADLMGVELKTYYRWLLENTLPLNRIWHFAQWRMALRFCHAPAHGARGYGD